MTLFQKERARLADVNDESRDKITRPFKRSLLAIPISSAFIGMYLVTMGQKVLAQQQVFSKC